ncbi:MAG: response regulator [Rhodospirillales bacterium]|nr:response regulator [Rhodospirillales bacterium]
MDGDLPHILVVDDDDRLRELLRTFLSDNGFLVTTARDAADARGKLRGGAFDVIVLDLMMPGETGLSLLDSLDRTRPMAVLMLTAMGELEHRIDGLERGADDYLGKPFEPRELLLRIHAILRRLPKPGTQPTQIVMGETRFDLSRGSLERGGTPIRLTSLEAILLKALAERPGTVLSREQLVTLTGAVGGERAVDVQVTRLRRKIEPDPRLPRYLHTVRGKGYVLRPD